MPYIEKDKRPQLETYLKTEYLKTGELNYIITLLIHNWLKTKGLNYFNLNCVIGVLECAKLELYRMIAAKYEDKKRLENGAISELDAINLNDVR